MLYVNWTLSRRPFYNDKRCTPMIHSAAILHIYTTINFTRLSVTTLAYGLATVIWAPCLRLAGRDLGMVDTCYSVKCAWLAGRDRCTESRHELETVNK